MGQNGVYNSNGKYLLKGMVEEIHPDFIKYYERRYSLFSLFDEGILLDEEGLYSVTPEAIAKIQADCCGSGTVVDAFAGMGGNAIQFARKNFNVIAIDIDPKKIECARNNAKADVIFLSPPWGGPEYKKARTYDIETMLKPRSGSYLFNKALSVAPSVAFYLPRTVNDNQVAGLASPPNAPALPFKIYEHIIEGNLISKTAYFGNIAVGL